MKVDWKVDWEQARRMAERDVRAASDGFFVRSLTDNEVREIVAIVINRAANQVHQALSSTARST